MLFIERFVPFGYDGLFLDERGYSVGIQSIIWFHGRSFAQAEKRKAQRPYSFAWTCPIGRIFGAEAVSLTVPGIADVHL
ncbi:hypothetical protein NYE76_01810 [Paenibacillus sp. FSL M7-0831]